VPGDSGVTWFGAADAIDDTVWRAPLSDWWALVSNFKEGRPITDPDLPPLDCHIAVFGDRATVSFGAGFRRELPVTASLVNDIEGVLHQWPARMPVTVIDSGAVAASVIEYLQRKGWEVTAEATDPTYVDVRWNVPDEDDEDDEDDDPNLVIGLQACHDAGGQFTIQNFGSDAAALCSYVADLPNLGHIKTRLKPAHPALAEATRLMTAAHLPWRPDRSEDEADLAGAMVMSGDLGLQLVIDGTGWMRDRLDLDDHPVVGRMTYMHDSWQDLLATVAHVASDRGSAYCALLEEPDCKHVIVSRDGEHARLMIRHVEDEFYGDAQHPYAGRLAGAWSGPFTDLVKVVAGASRSLIDNAGLDGIEDRWTLPAPLAELAGLESWLAH
jgi:hypothetical protein